MVRSLLSREEKKQYFIKFNVDGLLRGDYQSRMNGYATARQNGWMSANDIQGIGKPGPDPGGAGRGLSVVINGNMTKLADAGLFGTGQQGMPAGADDFAGKGCRVFDEEVLELEKQEGPG